MYVLIWSCNNNNNNNTPISVLSALDMLIYLTIAAILLLINLILQMWEQAQGNLPSVA